MEKQMNSPDDFSDASMHEPLTTPTERLAAALDAIPGIDDLEDRPDYVRMADIQSVRDALMDVMLGFRMAADETRSASGISSHIRFARQPTLAQLIQWQSRLQSALEKL